MRKNLAVHLKTEIPMAMSQEEIARVLGITRARVQQIELKALQKLRAYCSQHGIKAEDLLDVARRGTDGQDYSPRRA